MRTHRSISSDSQSIVQLFHSLCRSCAHAAGDHSRHRFATVEEQLDYLWLNGYLPNLEYWYINQFVPAIVQYERSTAKSASKAAKYYQLAELFGKENQLAKKAFEYVNEAIRHSPPTETEFLFNCFFLRSELHRLLAKDFESAVDDLAKALHYRPQSFNCIKHLVDLHLQCKRPLEAYRVVDNALNSGITEMTDSEIETLKVTKESLTLDTADSKETAPRETFTETLRHHIQVDSRVKMIRNEDNQRFYFQAEKFISAGETLIEEQPSMVVLKRVGLCLYCSTCLKPCPNTFWPCSNCIEVVFCSKDCLDENLEHQAECGIIGLLQSEISTKAVQTFRLLAQTGHDELLAMSKSVKTYSTENYLPKLKLQADHDAKEVANWFQLAQCDLRNQVHHRSPIRFSSELASAIFLFAMYLHKKNAKKLDNEEQTNKLIAILATDIAKVMLTQFGWQEKVDEKRQSIGAFQCLLGSHITHACEENSTWNYVDGKLVIKSKADIEAGQPITISYGSFDGHSFYKRQEQVKAFSVACNCSKCACEVNKHFALRCQHCPGPVPLDPELASTTVSLSCMRCERPYYNAAQAQKVVPHFYATQRLVWLVQAIDEDSEVDIASEHLKEIASRLDYLAGFVYPHSTQWLRLIADACELFYARNWFEQVVSWLHWFDLRFGIYPSKDYNNELTRLYELDMWTTAYTAHMAKAIDWLLDDNLAEHTATGQKLFKETFATLEKIGHRKDIDQLVESKQDMLLALHRATVDKCTRFAKVTQSNMVIPEEPNELRFESEETLSFLSITNSISEDRQEAELINVELASVKPETDNQQSIDQSGEDGDEGDGK